MISTSFFCPKIKNGFCVSKSDARQTLRQKFYFPFREVLLKYYVFQLYFIRRLASLALKGGGPNEVWWRDFNCRRQYNCAHTIKLRSNITRLWRIKLGHLPHGRCPKGKLFIFCTPFRQEERGLCHLPYCQHHIPCSLRS